MLRRVLAVCFLLLPARLLPAQDPALPAEVSGLVPANAVALIQLRSAQEVAGHVARVQQPLGAGDSMDGTQLLAATLGSAGFPGDVSKIDVARPIWVAFSFNLEGPMPVVTFLVPSADVEGLAASVELPPEFVRVAGSYAAVSLGNLAEASGKSKLLDGFPPAALAVRVDAGALIQRFRPLIDMGLDQAEAELETSTEIDPSMPIDMSASYETYFEWAREIADSAELLDTVLDVRGGELTLDFHLKSREGTPLAKRAVAETIDWASWSALLDPTAAMRQMWCYDQTESLAATFEMYGQMLDMMESELPPQVSVAMRTAMDGMVDLTPKLGRLAVLNAHAGKSGLRASAAYAPPDPRAMIDAFTGLVRNPIFAGVGLFSTEPVKQTLGGNEANVWRTTFDLEEMLAGIPESSEMTEEDLAMAQRVVDALLGKDGLRFATWTRGARVALLVGGDDAWQAAEAQRLSTATPSAAMLRAVEPMKGMNPGLFGQVDLALAFRGLGDVLEAVDLPEAKIEELDIFVESLGQKPMPITMHAGIAGVSCRAGGRIEMDAIVRLAGLIAALDAHEARLDEEHERTARIHESIRELENAVGEYALAHGTVPESLELLTKPDAEGAVLLEALPLDPWDRKFLYAKREGTPSFRIWTLGADGKEGGSGADADVDNVWEDD